MLVCWWEDVISFKDAEQMGPWPLPVRREEYYYMYRRSCVVATSYAIVVRRHARSTCMTWDGQYDQLRNMNISDLPWCEAPNLPIRYYFFQTPSLLDIQAIALGLFVVPVVDHDVGKLRKWFKHTTRRGERPAIARAPMLEKRASAHQCPEAAASEDGQLQSTRLRIAAYGYYGVGGSMGPR